MVARREREREKEREREIPSRAWPPTWLHLLKVPLLSNSATGWEQTFNTQPLGDT
jgi:hypothetical protein